MKKLFKKVICALAMTTSVGLLAGMSAFAAEGSELSAPSAELRAQADALPISHDVSNSVGEIKTLHEAGVRLFDTAGLMSAEDKDKMEMLLDGVAEKAGYDVAVFTAVDIDGYEHTEDFADYIYYSAELGTGADKDGSILVMEVGGPSCFIYTHGIAIRYLTDSGIDYIYDELDGGLWNRFEQGDYAGAAAVYARGILEAAEAGIAQDQYNVNTDTGEVDYYYEQKPRISFFQIILSAIISIIAGILPVKNVKASYAMKNANEVAKSGAINQAYRAVSAYKAISVTGGNLINRYETTERIVKQSSNDRGGSGGHFSGGSSVHSGMGGSVHGGGGRGSR